MARRASSAAKSSEFLNAACNTSRIFPLPYVDENLLPQAHKLRSQHAPPFTVFSGWFADRCAWRSKFSINSPSHDSLAAGFTSQLVSTQPREFHFEKSLGFMLREAAISAAILAASLTLRGCVVRLAVSLLIAIAGWICGQSHQARPAKIGTRFFIYPRMQSWPLSPSVAASLPRNRPPRMASFPEATGPAPTARVRPAR